MRSSFSSLVPAHTGMTNRHSVTGHPRLAKCALMTSMGHRRMHMARFVTSKVETTCRSKTSRVQSQGTLSKRSCARSWWEHAKTASSTFQISTSLTGDRNVLRVARSTHLTQFTTLGKVGSKRGHLKSVQLRIKRGASLSLIKVIQAKFLLYCSIWRELSLQTETF